MADDFESSGLLSSLFNKTTTVVYKHSVYERDGRIYSELAVFSGGFMKL